MKPLALLTIICIYLITLFSSTGCSSGKSSGAAPLSDSLTYSLLHKQDFVNAKEKTLSILRKKLFRHPSSTSYDALTMAENYAKFNLDSALFYADMALTNAATTPHPDVIKAKASLTLCRLYSMGGRFREAESILSSVNPQSFHAELKCDYYVTLNSFWDYYSIFTPHSETRPSYIADSLMKYLSPLSYTYKSRKVAEIASADSVRGNIAFKELLNTLPVGSPEYAMLTNYYGSFLKSWGRPDEAKSYFILSAIADLHNATRETEALQQLAKLLYEKGDVSHALTYSQSNLDDIIASGISLHSPEIYSFYSIISTAYNLQELEAKRRLLWFSIILASTFAVVAALAIYCYRQMKRISTIKHDLSESNSKLKELNQQLHNINKSLNSNNALLLEANKIKEEYITQFFDLCFCYISKMEQTQNTLHKLALNKAYPELLKCLKPGTGISDELEILYSRFDSVFLTLYPDFLEKLNSLLRQEERISLKQPFRLSRELRIFALLKLGISDGSKIASFLRCSTSTIYNYRTRFRNKAINRDNFEQDLIS